MFETLQYYVIKIKKNIKAFLKMLFVIWCLTAISIYGLSIHNEMKWQNIIDVHWQKITTMGIETKEFTTRSYQELKCKYDKVTARTKAEKQKTCSDAILSDLQTNMSWKYEWNDPEIQAFLDFWRLKPFLYLKDWSAKNWTLTLGGLVEYKPLAWLGESSFKIYPVNDFRGGAIYSSASSVLSILMILIFFHWAFVGNEQIRGASLFNRRQYLEETKRKFWKSKYREWKEDRLDLKVWLRRFKIDFHIAPGFPLFTFMKSRILLVGGSGSGKSVSLFNWIYELLEQGNFLFIYDRSRQFITKFYDALNIYHIIVDPFDQRFVERFGGYNVFRDYPKGESELFADMWVHTSGDSDHWETKAQTIWQIVHHEITHTNDDPDHTHVAKFFRKVGVSGKKFVQNIRTREGKELLGLVIESEINEEGELEIKGNLNELGSILSTVTKYATPFMSEAWGRPGTFSLRQYIYENRNNPRGGCIFLPNEMKFQAISGPMVAYLCEVVLATAMEEEGHRKMVAIMDEFPSIGVVLKYLIIAMNEGRKYGLSMILGLQSLSAQLAKVYGELGKAEIMDSANVFAVLSVAAKSQKEAAELLGHQVVKKKALKSSESMSDSRESTSMSQQNEKETEFVVTPTEIGMLDEMEGYVKIRGYNPVKTEFGHWKNKRIFKNKAQGFIPVNPAISGYKKDVTPKGKTKRRRKYRSRIIGFFPMFLGGKLWSMPIWKREKVTSHEEVDDSPMADVVIDNDGNVEEESPVETEPIPELATDESTDDKALVVADATQDVVEETTVETEAVTTEDDSDEYSIEPPDEDDLMESPESPPDDSFLDESFSDEAFFEENGEEGDEEFYPVDDD